MKPLKAVLIGAGARGAHAYAPYALKYPHELEFVAVAESSTERRTAFSEKYDIPAERVYSSWEQLLDQPKIADAAFICTMDQMHFEPTLKALELGYHVLLEKPMSPDPKQCIEMELAAEKHNRVLTICHVLRYTPFWSTMKRLISEGTIGDVVSIQLNENVGYFHMAHSFVRGNWRNSDLSSPMILQKSCHDMDVLSWLMDQECVRISSFGSLMHFHSKNAPEGAMDRCLDGCAAEAVCPYSAPRFYLGEGSGWAANITNDSSRQGVLKALQEGPYGRCVYKCDNNVVDHQVVNMEFANGATAMFSMCGFTHDVSRGIQVMGTKGEIRGYMEHHTMTVYDFLTKQQTEVRVHTSADGHGGGDDGIVGSFLREARNYSGGESLTSAKASVRSHLMAFAAEQSRIHAGKTIDLAEFRNTFTQSYIHS